MYRIEVNMIREHSILRVFIDFFALQVLNKRLLSIMIDINRHIDAHFLAASLANVPRKRLETGMTGKDGLIGPEKRARDFVLVDTGRVRGPRVGFGAESRECRHRHDVLVLAQQLLNLFAA